MEIINKLLIVICICGSIAVEKADCQKVSTFRLRKISTRGSCKLDSLSILPNSLSINGFDSSYYSINYTESTIQWRKNIPTDSILIAYRVIPFSLNKTIYRYNYDSVKNRFLAGNKMIISKGVSSLEEYFGGKKINYTGSFGRNMRFGNTQDATFNSEFNLQINGIICDSIELTAAITDNNIPIQPDGNTKQLNEFDRILIQFKKNKWEINLGDIDLKEKQLYFLNFYKRSQGLLYTQQGIKSLGSKHNLTLGAGIAKGKFHRNIFQGLEGNQGPYKLQGANNELYFVVLSNTERVYIDGELMQRGIDQDYTINYNTAEITFTTKRLITKDKRIQVEFEYADKNYLNYLAFVEDNITVNKKFSLVVAAYNNNDVASSTINQSLDNKQRQFISNIGDSINNAFYPSGNKDSFSTTQIMYKKVDTIYNGIHDSIYIYSTNSDSAMYVLTFVATGNNKGNYIPLYNAANGKVYQWIAPLNGIHQGSYEPAIYLVTPKSQQILSIKSDYRFSKKTVLTSEFAGSRYDVNTLSSKDKKNDNGYAGKFQFLHANTFLSTRHSYDYNVNIGYEYVNDNFKSLEILRSSEFSRDWALNNNTTATEQLPSIDIIIKDEKNNQAEYSFKAYLRSDGYKGTMQQLKILKSFLGIKFQSAIQYTDNKTPFINGYYFKPNIEIEKTFTHLHNIAISGSFASEYNHQLYTSFDSLSLNSFAFTSYTLLLKSNTINNNKWYIGFTERTNRIPIGNMLLSNDISRNYTYTIELLKNKKHQFRINATYRELIQEYGATKGSKESTVLSRSEYLFSEWKGNIKGNVIYEIGNGQEQKKDVSYVQVSTGRGQYVWIDYNNDGIQQLNEFEIAQFQDQANYVRVFTPTNSYTKSNYTLLGYNLTISPNARNNSDSKFIRQLQKISFQSSLQTQTKTLYDGNLRFNPFMVNIADTSLIQSNYSWNNTLSYNRYGNWGVDLGRNANFNKSLLTYGLESNELTEYSIRGRFDIKQKFQIEVLQKFTTKVLSTPSFNNRNYELTGISTEPRLIFSPTIQWRLTTYYQYSTISNLIVLGGENAINNSLNMESKLNFVQNASINFKFSSSNISYSGASNNTINYVMLNGLQPGKNYIWNLEFTKRLMNSLEISFNYEGRKTGDNQTVNVGRASVKAIL